MTSFHDPVPDRLLGPLARPLVGRVPPMALTLLSLGAAAVAFAAFVAEYRFVAGVLILLAALLDAGTVAPRSDPSPDLSQQGRDAGGGPASEARGWGPARAVALALDTLADRYADTLIFAGMAVWAQGQDAGPAPLALGFAAAAGALGFGYGVVRVWASAGLGPAALLFGPLGRDLCLLVAAAGALTGIVYPALVVLAVAGNLPVFVALARLPAYLRDETMPTP